MSSDNFYITDATDPVPKKRFYLWRIAEAGFGVLISGFLTFGIWDMEWWGHFIFGVPLLFFGWLVYRNVQKMRAVDEKEVFQPLVAAPASFRKHFYKRAIILLIIGCAVLSWMTAQDLGPLERMEVYEVQVTFPMGLVYEYFGYWPAVLTPLLGAAIFSVIGWRKYQDARDEVGPGKN